MIFNFFHFPTINSTNAEALRRIKNHIAKEGDIITADSQTNGYGTRGRVWHSPLGNLYFSLILKPNCDDISSYNALSSLFGLSILESIKPFVKHPIRFKLPNDILIENKKVSGILIETFHPFVVVGIGVNVQSCPIENTKPATYLQKYTKKIPDLLNIILNNMMKHYFSWKKNL